MISYCLVAYRPVYSKLLIRELIKKTSVPYEILIWLNVDDPGLEECIAVAAKQGHPIRLVAKTPQNVGMKAFRELFALARYSMVVQLDDDVVYISRNIAQIVSGVFQRHRDIGMITAHVWQDEYTSGSHPPLEKYKPSAYGDGLMLGPIDGGFSVYSHEALAILPSAPYENYFCLGAWVANELMRRKNFGVLSTKIKMFHVVGPVYVSYYGMLDFEIEKYKRVSHQAVVNWYETARASLPPKAEVENRIRGIEAHFESYGLQFSEKES